MLLNSDGKSFRGGRAEASHSTGRTVCFGSLETSILRRLILSDDTSAFLETPLDTDRSAKAKAELKCHQDLYPSKRLVYWDIKSIYFLKSKG